MVNPYEEMGERLRAFLKDFRKGEISPDSFPKMRREAKGLLKTASLTNEPLFLRKVEELIFELELFFQKPGSRVLGEKIAKCLLELEQQTREI